MLDVHVSVTGENRHKINRQLFHRGLFPLSLRRSTVYTPTFSAQGEYVLSCFVHSCSFSSDDIHRGLPETVQKDS